MHIDWKLFTQGISNVTENTVVKCQVFACWWIGCPKKNFNPRYLFVFITKEQGNIANEAYGMFFLFFFFSFFLFLYSNCYVVGSSVLFFNLIRLLHLRTQVQMAVVWNFLGFILEDTWSSSSWIYGYLVILKRYLVMFVVIKRVILWGNFLSFATKSPFFFLLLFTSVLVLVQWREEGGCFIHLFVP